MARLVKPKEKFHMITLQQPFGDHVGELTLVGTGKRSYLWSGSVEGGRCQIFSGVVALRKLAKAILKEVGEV